MLKYFLAIVVFGVSLGHLSCLQDSYSVTLSGPITIGNEWIELHPESPLKADKDQQDVILILTTDFDLRFKQVRFEKDEDQPETPGIILPSGDVINPEVQVVDQYGNVFDLVLSGANSVGRFSLSYGPTYSLPSPNKLPRDRVYTTVRIRSAKPITFKALYWFCDSVKDWK